MCVCQGGAPTKLGFVSRAIENVIPIVQFPPVHHHLLWSPLTFVLKTHLKTHLQWAYWQGTNETLKFVGFRTFVPPWCSQWRSQFVLRVFFEKFILDDALPNAVSIVLRNSNVCVSLSCVWPSVPTLRMFPVFPPHICLHPICFAKCSQSCSQ